jgi:hypothetical protein
VFATEVLTAGADRGGAGSGDDPVVRLDAIGERGRVLAAQISAAQAELVSLVAEAETTERLGMTTAAWVAWQWGLTPGEARQLTRLAGRLPALPKIAAALAAGELSPATVTSLVSVATPELEDRLLDTARVAMAGQLQTLVRALRRQHELDAGPAADPPAQKLSWYWDDNAMLRLSGRLNATVGAQLEAALRAAKDTDNDETTTDHRTPDDQRPTVDNPEALLRLAQSYLAGTVDTHGVIPARFQIIVRLDHNDRTDQLDGSINGGGPLAPHTITELLCESWLSIVTTRHARPVTTVRPHRFAHPDQVRALMVRDRGMCRFPGCGRSTYLKAHHILDNQYGGPTHLDNLILLCQKHHTVIHQPGWALTYHPHTDTITVTRPDGRTLQPAQRPPPGRPPPPPSTRNTGTGEPLTTYAKDVTIAHWLN